MKVSWFDSEEDFKQDIQTSIIFKSGDTQGVCDAIDARRVLRNK